MREWWNTPQAAYAFLTLGIGGGAVLTYVSPQIGIPIGGSLIIVGIILLINAYKNKSKKGSDQNEMLEEARKANPAIALKDMAIKAAKADEVEADSLKLTSIMLTKQAVAFEVTVQNVSIGSLLFDKDQKITQFLIRLTLKASGEIQLSKLDLVYEDMPYEPVRLPTILVKGTESYEVEYRVPGSAAIRLAKYGYAPNNEQPQAYFNVLGGGLDFNTKPFSIFTPKRLSTPDKGGSQT